LFILTLLTCLALTQVDAPLAPRTFDSKTIVGVVAAAWKDDGSLGSVTLTTFDGDSECTYPLAMNSVVETLAKNQDGKRVALLTPSIPEPGSELSVTKHYDVVSGHLAATKAESDDEAVLVLRISPDEMEPGGPYKIVMNDMGVQLRPLVDQRVQIVGSLAKRESQTWLRVDSFLVVTRGTLERSESGLKLRVEKPQPNCVGLYSVACPESLKEHLDRWIDHCVDVVGPIVAGESLLVPAQVIPVYHGLLEVSRNGGGEIVACSITRAGEKTTCVALDKRGLMLARTHAGSKVEATGLVRKRDGTLWLTVKTFCKAEIN
jgi:hypothetical protein